MSDRAPRRGHMSSSNHSPRWPKSCMSRWLQWCEHDSRACAEATTNAPQRYLQPRTPLLCHPVRLRKASHKSNTYRMHIHIMPYTHLGRMHNRIGLRWRAIVGHNALLEEVGVRTYDTEQREYRWKVGIAREDTEFWPNPMVIPIQGQLPNPGLIASLEPRVTRLKSSKLYGQSNEWLFTMTVAVATMICHDDTRMNISDYWWE